MESELPKGLHDKQAATVGPGETELGFRDGGSRRLVRTQTLGSFEAGLTILRQMDPMWRLRSQSRATWIWA